MLQSGNLGKCIVFYPEIDSINYTQKFENNQVIYSKKQSD